MCRYRKAVIGITIGALVFVLGLTCFLSFPSIYRILVNKQLVIFPNSESYPFWKDIPIPIYLKIYFFNITNPLNVSDYAAKPILQQIGPYVYREERHKVNLIWNNNGTVSYQQNKTWYFEPTMSNGSLMDTVITLNVPLVAAVTLVQQDKPSLLPALSLFLKFTSTRLIIQKQVHELIFDGYTDSLLKFAYYLHISPWKKFAWFYERNNTNDGIFTIFTGKDGMKSHGYMDKWNGIEKLNIWHSFCNDINGSAGDMWPPMEERKSKITLFSADICRSLSLYFLEKTQVKGITGYRYYGNLHTIDNGNINPETKCFCTGSCLPAGALNMSTCKFNAPVVLSYPHFLYADKVYVNDIVGMNPQSKLHQSYIDIQPVLGVPLTVAIRFQINIILHRIHSIRELRNIQNMTYFPLIWFEETGILDDKIADEFNFILFKLPFIGELCSLFILALGAISALFLGVYIFWSLKKRNNLYTEIEKEIAD